MSLKTVWWGRGMKLVVDGPSKFVILGIGQGPFDSVIGSLDSAIENGKIECHSLSQEQLDWLRKQKEELV
jgi:hypothetical protein